MEPPVYLAKSPIVYDSETYGCLAQTEPLADESDQLSELAVVGCYAVEILGDLNEYILSGGRHGGQFFFGAVSRGAGFSSGGVSGGFGYAILLW